LDAGNPANAAVLTSQAVSESNEELRDALRSCACRSTRAKAGIFCGDPVSPQNENALFCKVEMSYRYYPAGTPFPSCSIVLHRRQASDAGPVQ
jgi:hypothetical protein